MPSTFSQSLRIELIGAGEQAGTWNITTNNNLGSLIEQAISGNAAIDVTLGNVTLTALNGVVDQSRNAVITVSGTPGTTRVLTIPNVQKMYTVRNTSDSTAQIKTSTGVAYSIPPASQAYIYCDGSNNISGRTITDGAATILNNPTPFNSPAFTGTPTAPTAATGTNTTQIATTAFVNASTALAIPTGVIVMWSGSIATIPSGWLLCNGSNGTPDLRDRFIVGAGSSYAPGNTGGANTVTLTESQIPAHTHTGTTNNTDPAHTHTFTTGNQSNDHTHSGTTATVDINHTHSGTTGTESNGHVHSGTTGGENVGHTHGVSGNTGGQSADHSHSGTTASENQNHTHGFSGTTGGGGAHSHTYDRTFRGSGFDVEDGNSFTLFESGATTSGVGDHVHGFSGTTGGISNNHQHAFSTGGVSSNHTHYFEVNSGGISNGHVHGFTTGDISANHTHGFTTGGMNSNNVHSHTFSTGGVSANHTHSGTTNSTSISHNHTFTTNATGGGQAHENRPPYFALCFIMKT